MAVTRIGLYDCIAVICLVLGFAAAMIAALAALEMAWLRMAVFAILAALLLHISALFAKLAIASSGRQR